MQRGKIGPCGLRLSMSPAAYTHPFLPCLFTLFVRPTFVLIAAIRGGKRRVGWETRNSGGYCHLLLQRHTFGKKTTDVVLRERKQLCAFCCTSLLLCRYGLQAKCAKDSAAIRLPCEQMTCRRIPLRQIGRQLYYA